MLATGVPTARVSPQSHISGCTTRVRNWKGRSAGEVPGRTRRPRRGRDVGGSRPARPARRSRSSPASCSRPTDDGTLTPLGVRLRGLGPDHRRRRGRARPARCSCSAGCSPTSRATCRRKPVDVVTDGTKVQVTCGSSRFTLLTMPVDDYPTLPVMPDGHRHDRRRRLHPGRRPGHHRGRPRRHAADPHRRPGRDRGRQGHPARHRPLPAGDARAHLEPRGHRRQPRRPGPGPHAVRHRQGARRQPARSRSPSAAPPAATG